MYKNEIYPADIVEDMERTLFHPQKDRRIEGQTDRYDETSIPHFQLHWNGGYNDFLMWFLIGWHLSFQQVRRQLWKKKLNDIDFNMEMSLKKPLSPLYFYLL